MWLDLNVNASSSGPLDVAQIGVAPPPPRPCLLSARWLVGLTLLTSISVLQSDASAAVIWPAGWSSRTVSLSLALRGLRLMMPPNEAPFPWSQIKMLPIWHGSPIQMCNSRAWGRERRRKHATKFLWFAKFRKRVSHMYKAQYETSPLTQLPPGLRRLF